MENKEGLRLLILMFLCIGLVATINATETPSAVKVFYGGMETLSTLPSTSDPEVISQIELNMQKCFYGPENSGINLQNDFRFFNIDKKSPFHNNGILPSNAYIKKLKKYLHEERVLKVNYCVKSNTVGGAVPVLSGNQKMKASAYIETIVEKKFIPVNEEIRIIIDTVTTYIETGKIGSIESSSSNGASDVDINKMRIKAAQLYQQENYNKAYELYEQIVKLDEKDAASLYYIGLMTYWQEGCKQQYSKKKKAKKAALDYLNRASYYSNSSQLSDKIEHALTVIKYNGDIPF